MASGLPSGSSRRGLPGQSERDLRRETEAPSPRVPLVFTASASSASRPDVSTPAPRRGVTVSPLWLGWMDEDDPVVVTVGGLLLGVAVARALRACTRRRRRRARALLATREASSGASSQGTPSRSSTTSSIGCASASIRCPTASTSPFPCSRRGPHAAPARVALGRDAAGDPGAGGRQRSRHRSLRGILRAAAGRGGHPDDGRRAEPPAATGRRCSP